MSKIRGQALSFVGVRSARVGADMNAHDPYGGEPAGLDRACEGPRREWLRGAGHSVLGFFAVTSRRGWEAATWPEAIAATEA